MKRFLQAAVVPLSIIAALMAILLAGGIAEARRDAVAEPHDTKLCPQDGIIADDGDSFSCDGEPVRVLGIDTPEIMHPQHGILEDQEKGREAAAFTSMALREAKRVVIVRGTRDHYGRTLAHVLLDGELLAVKLIKAGLAVPFGGDRKRFPEFSLQIDEAAKVAPKPSFEAPAKWRKKHQKKKDVLS